jgi:hypothetical protein
MNFPNTQIPITYEALMASIYENDRIIKEKFVEFERILKEQAAAADRRGAEADRRGAEADRRGVEADRRGAEAAQRGAEAEARINKYQTDYEKRMKKMEENMGNWSNNHGSFAEEYFFNSFENEQQNFFGEHFNKISKNVKPVGKDLEDEYDVVMYNDSYVAIVEAKFKAHKNDIPKVIKKAETFRILCPDYKDFKIYLGLASLSFYKELEQECRAHGIAIIKQVGDTVVIYDDHLKVF